MVTMKTIQHRLQIIFWSAITISVTILILGELDIITNGILAGENQTDFIIISIMELYTIVAIPTALKLFKFKPISKQLTSDNSLAALNLWGVVRLLLLCVPMVVNLICYYLFMTVGFGYLAIILFLSLFFVYPSLSRCYNETDSNNS